VIKMMRPSRTSVLWLFLLLPLFFGPALAAQDERLSADAILRQMSSYLGSARAFQFRANLTFDDVPVSDIKVQYSGSMEVYVRRPGSLQVNYRDDLSVKRFWLDGGKATVLEPREKLWASADGESTIDASLKRLAADYGVSLPLDDLLFSDPYSGLMGDVKRHRYVGLHEVEGVPCHHLVFGQENVNWQIWIEAGDRPLPRKVVITYKTLPMAPEYAALFVGWDLSPELPESRFRPDIPAEAAKIDFKTLEETQR